MMRVNQRRFAPGCLAALVLFCGSIHAESLHCKAQSASGFVYDKTSDTWMVSSFPVEDRQYLVAPANADDLFARALKFDYEVREASTSKPVIHCKAARLPDSNEETGLILCKGSFGATFNIDRRTGRYIRTQPTGYVLRQASTQADEDGPFMEIGNCDTQ